MLMLNWADIIYVVAITIVISFFGGFYAGYKHRGKVALRRFFPPEKNLKHKEGGIVKMMG